MGGKKYPSRTRLNSGRVRVPPTGKKMFPYPYPSGRVPDGYRVPVPELPSLVVLCLVDRTPVEVEWQTPLTRFRAFIPRLESGMLRT
jgi:hypothetical protein